MQKAATSEELKKAFGDHLETTKGHVTRIEDAFGKLGEKAARKEMRCDGRDHKGRHGYG